MHVPPGNIQYEAGESSIKCYVLIELLVITYNSPQNPCASHGSWLKQPSCKTLSSWWWLCGNIASLDTDLLFVLRWSTFRTSCLEAWAWELCTLPHWFSIWPIVVNAVMRKQTFVFFYNHDQETMRSIIVQDMIYLSRFMKKTDCKVNTYYPSPAFGGVWCSLRCHIVTRRPGGAKLPPDETSSRCIWVRVHWPLLEYGQHLPDTCQMHCLLKTLFGEIWLESQYQQYHPMFMNDGLAPSGNLLSEGWDWPVPLLFNFSQCTVHGHLCASQLKIYR